MPPCAYLPHDEIRGRALTADVCTCVDTYIHTFTRGGGGGGEAANAKNKVERKKKEKGPKGREYSCMYAEQNQLGKKTCKYVHTRSTCIQSFISKTLHADHNFFTCPFFVSLPLLLLKLDPVGGNKPAGRPRGHQPSAPGLVEPGS